MARARLARSWSVSLSLVPLGRPPAHITITFPLSTHTSIQRATWHVPPGLALVAQHGASADADGKSFDSKSTSSTDAPLNVDVALKVIPKKKVKGNESSVWGEMEVLKGLDHPNIVRFSLPGALTALTSCSVGQVLRMVRISLQILPLLRAGYRRRAI